MSDSYQNEHPETWTNTDNDLADESKSVGGDRHQNRTDAGTPERTEAAPTGADTDRREKSSMPPSNGDHQSSSPDGDVHEKQDSGPVDNEESSRAAVTPSTIGELHRRIISVTSSVTDAESHLSMVAELSGVDAGRNDSSVSQAEIAAELEQLDRQLEEAAHALQQARAGTQELYRSAVSEADEPVDREVPEGKGSGASERASDTGETEDADNPESASQTGLTPVDDDVVRNTDSEN